MLLVITPAIQDYPTQLPHLSKAQAQPSEENLKKGFEQL